MTDSDDPTSAASVPKASVVKMVDSALVLRDRNAPAQEVAVEADLVLF
jgi:hypothetical protein